MAYYLFLLSLSLCLGNIHFIILKFILFLCAEKWLSWKEESAMACICSCKYFRWVFHGYPSFYRMSKRIRSHSLFLNNFTDFTSYMVSPRLLLKPFLILFYSIGQKCIQISSEKLNKNYKKIREKLFPSFGMHSVVCASNLFRSSMLLSELRSHWVLHLHQSTWNEYFIVIITKQKHNFSFLTPEKCNRKITIVECYNDITLH